MKDSLMSLRLVGHYSHQHRKLNFCVRKGNRCFQPIMAVFKITLIFAFIKLFIPFIFTKLGGVAGVVKRNWLRTSWLSACTGPNPVLRIFKKNGVIDSINSECL